MSLHDLRQLLAAYEGVHWNPENCQTTDEQFIQTAVQHLPLLLDIAQAAEAYCWALNNRRLEEPTRPTGYDLTKARDRLRQTLADLEQDES